MAYKYTIMYIITTLIVNYYYLNFFALICYFTHPLSAQGRLFFQHLSLSFKLLLKSLLAPSELCLTLRKANPILQTLDA